MSLFKDLGFLWEPPPPSGPAQPVEQVLARYEAALPRFVFDAMALEGNPLALPEIEALMAGEKLSGREEADQRQALNFAAAARDLGERVRTGGFRLDKDVFCRLHGLLAREEALEWGWFRGEGRETHYTPHVGLGPGASWRPPPTLPGAAALKALFARGLAALAQVSDPRERAMAFFLFGALQQFVFDGNKRTSRLMMCGLLLSHGLEAISIPAETGGEFDALMARFYQTKDGSEMMRFLISLQPGEA